MTERKSGGKYKERKWEWGEKGKERKRKIKWKRNKRETNKKGH